VATYADVLKVAEHEFGIQEYQKVTRAFRAAWCVSFEQFCLKQVGLGPIANSTAGVWYLWGYAKEHGWNRTHPKAGYIAILPGLNRSGHTGFVTGVTGRRIRTIEGNSGNTVMKHDRDISEFVGFVAYPAKNPKPPKPPPLFQLVVGEGKAAHVVAIGPWGTLRLRVPQLVGKYKFVRVKRKWRL
jgi:hypothetical protein